MPRGRPKSNPSIADLQAMIRARRGERQKLVNERKKLQKRLDKIDREIAAFDGESGNGAGDGSVGTRPRNAQPLPDAIAAVLKSGKGSMRVGDIAEAVQSNGYRSSSDNFKGIVNQALIKDARFKQDGRGVYKLAK